MSCVAGLPKKPQPAAHSFAAGAAALSCGWNDDIVRSEGRGRDSGHDRDHGDSGGGLGRLDDLRVKSWGECWRGRGVYIDGAMGDATMMGDGSLRLGVWLVVEDQSGRNSESGLCTWQSGTQRAATVRARWRVWTSKGKARSSSGGSSPLSTLSSAEASQPANGSSSRKGRDARAETYKSQRARLGLAGSAEPAGTPSSSANRRRLTPLVHAASVDHARRRQRPSNPNSKLQSRTRGGLPDSKWGEGGKARGEELSSARVSGKAELVEPLGCSPPARRQPQLARTRRREGRRVAGIEVSSRASKRLSPKRSGSFKLSLPGLLCGQCKATAVSSPPDSPTGSGGSGARSLSSSSASASSSGTSRGRDRMAELREIFRHFDRDMDGRISGREMREFFASMGDGGLAALGQGQGLGLDGAGGGGDDLMLGFDDFVRIVESKGGEEEEREDLRRAFEAFEAVKGSGRITPRGLQRVLSQLGDEPSVAECEAMIRAYDDDGDGELDFHRMMNQD
ncbi:putative calcium-binding protein CML41 [Panicum miliaceum]|uniref:Calcium-binding protein CML41 n=1 Tax=Panicum miliaceum TaxID=4540 RepID=A0A3L6SIE6_PANMI|nr:putative calcium-binding protein CML41 [Panicum miliaceum]